MKVVENFKVREIMTTSVITVPMSASVKEVVKILAQEHITAAVVVAPNNEAIGVISEMDIVKAFNEDLDKLTAEDIMSESIITIQPDSTIAQAAELMKTKKIHRCVIVHEKDRLGIPHPPVGILCASDIVRLMVHRGNFAKIVKNS